MTAVRFVYKCQGCGHSTTSESPDLMNCPIPWRPDGDVVVSDGDPPCVPCGTEYEDGPMLDWDLLPNDIQLAVRDLLRPPSRTENVDSPREPQ